MSEAVQESRVRTLVLIDPGLSEPLEPILREVGAPMLPLGSKPMIQHWLERAADMGVTRVRILLSHFPEKTRQFVGDGSRWGLSVDYAAYRLGQDGEGLWALLADIDPTAVLVASLVGWPSTDLLPHILERASAADSTPMSLHAEAFMGQLCATSSCPWHKGWQGLDDTLCRDFSSLKGYWELNMQLISGEIWDPLPFGFELMPGLRAASNCRIDKGATVLGANILGESCIVRDRAVLGPNAIVGAHSVIEEAASVTNSVVFPRSYVGSHIQIRDAIVAGDVIYNADSDVLLYINDPEIVARREHTWHRVALRQRLLALLLIAVLSPVVVARALFLRLSGKRAFVREQWFAEEGVGLDGQRLFGEVSLLSLDVPSPLWRRVTWLGAVVSGELPLVGTSLRASTPVPYPDWVNEAEVFKPGIISLALVEDVSQDDIEAVIIADAYQLAREQLGLNFTLVRRWIQRLFVLA